MFELPIIYRSLIKIKRSCLLITQQLFYYYQSSGELKLIIYSVFGKHFFFSRKPINNHSIVLKMQNCQVQQIPYNI